MKNTKFIIGALFTAILALTGCVKEEDGGSKALLLSDNTITFEAVEAPEQTISVYADADWTAVCDIDWITLDLTSGTGNTPVMIRVADNVDSEGGLQLPREGEVSFYGRSESIVARLTVKQLGDTYLGAKEMTVSEAVAAEDGTPMGLKESQVLAVCGHGFVVSDGAKSLYVKGESSVKIGDKITVKGIKKTEKSVPVLDDVENVTVNSSTEAVNGPAKDLATAESVEVFDYLLLDGTLVGTSIIAGSVTADICASSEDLSKFNAHYVKAYAYYVGSFGYILVSDIEDKGVNEDVKLPVEWNVNEVKDNGLSSRATEGDDENWVNKGILNPISGFGYIQYVMSDDYPLEGSGGTRVRDVEAGNPRVSGAWIGDYWEFASYVPAQAGDIIKLEFEGRISGAGLRYWRMQYLDGTEWKDVIKANTIVDIKGNEVIYTHDFADGDGSNVNHIYSNAVQYVNATNMIVFRMTCVSAVRGNNAEPLTKPSTASMRLDADAPVHPKISVGQISDLPNDNVANVEVTVDKSLTFEAVPGEPKSFRVLSDNEVELTTDSDWIFFVGAEETLVESVVIPAGEETEVFVNVAENTVAETREGEITVKSGATTETITVTQVSPGVTLEPLISLVVGNGSNVNFDVGSFNLSVQTNVEFEVEDDAAWVTVEAVPATRALVDYKTYVVNYQANSEPAERIARIRVFNAEKNLESVYTLVQSGYVSGVFFQDDFTWVAPFVDADIANGRPQGDSMLDNAQYLVKSSYDLDGFEAKLTELGYEALFPASKAIYVMKGNYLKFSRGDHINGIRLPKMNFNGESAVALTFDWGRNNGKNAPADNVELEVTVEGNGTINGQKKSAPIIHTKGDWEWQTETIVITGVDNDTRITIRPTTFVGEVSSGNYRWFLDNVKVEKYEGEVPGQVEPLNVSWLFSADAMNDATTGYAATFGTTAGVEDKTAGDGGQYVNANVSGNGKITYVQIDKTSLTYTSDKNGNPYKSTRITGGTGQPYVTGMWIGDYWLFEATDGTTYPAGTKVNVSYLTRTSATGIRYWRLEYLDGADWKPAMEVSTIEGTDLQYNVAMNPDGKTDTQINAVVTLTNPTENVKFRMVCVGGTLANGKAIPEGINGGTCRIAGAEGTSPVIKVITE